MDDPNCCLEGLAKIGAYEGTKFALQMNFKGQYCRDVLPYTLLTEFWSEMLPLFKGEEMDFPLQKVLAAIGIKGDLKVGFQGVVDFDDVWAFPLERRRRSGDSQSKHLWRAAIE